MYIKKQLPIQKPLGDKSTYVVYKTWNSTWQLLTIDSAHAPFLTLVCATICWGPACKCLCWYDAYTLFSLAVKENICLVVLCALVLILPFYVWYFSVSE